MPDHHSDLHSYHTSMNQTICDIVDELSGSLVYSTLILLKFILCSLGSVLTAVQWRRRGVRWLVNANSKAFFAYYYALTFAMGVIYAAIYAFEFTRLRCPCFIFDFRLPLVFRSAGIATIIASHYIMVSLSLERLYSSLYPLRFEQSNSKMIAIITGTTIILTSYVLIFLAMSDGFALFYVTRRVATIDLRIPENKLHYQITLNVITYSVIVSGVIFMIDVYLNYFRTSRRSSKLGINYQFAENRKVISTLLPVEITNSFLSICATLAQVVYTAVNPKATYLERALFTEFATVAPLYPLAFAVIIEWRIGFRKSRAIAVMNCEQQQHEHFASLNTLWK